MGDEADSLSEMYSDYIPDSDEIVREIKYEIRRDARIYAMNKKAKVGSTCACAGPKCARRFVKKSYQQAFHDDKCKDQFWNRVRFWKDSDKVDALVAKLDYMKYGDEYD